MSAIDALRAWEHDEGFAVMNYARPETIQRSLQWGGHALIPIIKILRTLMPVVARLDNEHVYHVTEDRVVMHAARNIINTLVEHCLANAIAPPDKRVELPHLEIALCDLATYCCMIGVAHRFRKLTSGAAILPRALVESVEGWLYYDTREYEKDDSGGGMGEYLGLTARATQYHPTKEELHEEENHNRFLSALHRRDVPPPNIYYFECRVAVTAVRECFSNVVEIYKSMPGRSEDRSPEPVDTIRAVTRLQKALGRATSALEDGTAECYDVKLVTKLSGSKVFYPANNP
jgi:hypothetical protein